MLEPHVWSRAAQLSNQEKQDELHYVLESAPFARSEQLRAFLIYVCRMEMEGRADELNEYLIGVEALGRRADYSPAEDSSVRSRAWELRQKLLKLYSTERSDSHLRIDLPRGGYAPQYLVRSHDADEQLQATHEIALLDTHVAHPPPPQVWLSRNHPILIGLLSGLVVVLVAAGVAIRKAPPRMVSIR